MLDFCQKLIIVAFWLENVVWFPASASLKTGSKLRLFRLSKISLVEDPACRRSRLSKIPLVEDPACGAGRGGAVRCGAVLVRLGCSKTRISPKKV